ncbi:transaldolase [Geomonas terrae]|uniref:Transaldolase n=1 Tax=Geomonas terrae TaxID=2562681 RepID=A0A4S1CBN6_9BACT|nr:transaldolase family protein [Geomonas terrae]TGU70769.1 transaldolase [Geomonas terrae]
MRDTPITRLRGCGQSVWLDGIGRSMLLSGELAALVQEDGVSGLASSAASLERLVAAGSDYDASIAFLSRRGLGATHICAALLTEDARLAAELLRPVYELSKGEEGFATLEVSPRLARDAGATVAEARRLWDTADCPNLYISIPGTLEGVAALRQLVREGISVCVTLVFSVPRYRAVADAYLDALAQRAARGLPLECVTSVVELPLMQIDRLLEPLLSSLARGENAERSLAEVLKGKAAIAIAKALRCVNREIHGNDRYRVLAARGGRAQRLVWASSGAGDLDLTYSEALVGADTVQLMAPATLAAFREHGASVCRLDDGVQEAIVLLENLCTLGVNLHHLAHELEDEGVERLTRHYDSLLRNIELKRRAAL